MKSPITALFFIGLLVITSHTLAQAVSNVITSNASCPLFIDNQTKVSAEVGVSNGPTLSLNPGAKAKLETSCALLQKTATNYSNLVKRELTTIGDATATYSMTLKEPTTEPTSNTQAEAVTTKLSTDAADYVWITTTAKICMTGTC